MTTNVDITHASDSDFKSDGMIGDEEPPIPRVVGDDFHFERSVFTDVSTRREDSPPAPDDARDGANGDAVGGTPAGDGAARAAASSPSKNGGALGSSADVADMIPSSWDRRRPASSADDSELVRLRAILEAREAEILQLKGLVSL
jgi:hypothetical protein